MRPLLRDPDLDQQVADRGFAVVDLLDGSEVAALCAELDELDHRRFAPGASFASGFHASIMDGRLDYRRTLFDAIDRATDPAFDRLTVDLQLVLVNRLCKEPGAGPVPNHIDWSFVDEPEHRSLSVWMPLSDTDAATGAIGVCGGSHHVVPFVRATAHPAYPETDEWGAALPDRQLVPLAAGQAVVFDHRLVHFSSPHHGPGERVAISCELVPAEAPLVHFTHLGPDRFLRHEVDAEFFLHFDATQDPASVPGHRSTTEVARPSWTALEPAAGEVEPTTEPDPITEPLPKGATPAGRRWLRRRLSARR